IAVTQILTFFIAGGDKGRSGKPIGCNDSVVPVAWEISPDQDPLRAALDKLFEFKDQYVGPIALYNALYQSNLKLDSYEADENGIVTVHLSGEYLLGGVCDNPRFQAQIEETVMQFPGFKEAHILINDIPLEDILSGK
ncbi:MAG: GerMN domain-containing protein, partial [Chloroflexi bacterium]|nr:GerMN domain-containing protein [Chloroflexota bacterium]